MDINNFEAYIQDNEILRALTIMKYHNPTKIQSLMIPLLLKENDIIAKSQTGSGKTAAFAIPICEKINWEMNSPQVLVLSPTRELALQVKEEIFNIGRFKRIKVEAIFGRMPFEKQRKSLKQKTHIVVGTPGRIMDHLEKNTLDVSKIKYLIIDEADEMFSMGFADQMEMILSKLPTKRVTVLLSATINDSIMNLCNHYMVNPQYIEATHDKKSKNDINQDVYEVEQNKKLDLLDKLLVVKNPESCIIFANTKDQVDEIYFKLLKDAKLGKRLHGGMQQKERLKVIADFKHGLFTHLVSTDVMARGIDIDDVELVINFDFPQEIESYIHRIGRTGRMNKKGLAISFVTKEDNYLLNKVVKETQVDILYQVEPTVAEVKKNLVAFNEKISRKTVLKKQKGMAFNDEIQKLHINAGKKTKMRALDIVGALCAIEGITAQDIGNIDIIDISSFVEILNNKGEYVYNILQTMPIKGRVRRVSKANKTIYEQLLEKQ